MSAVLRTEFLKLTCKVEEMPQFRAIVFSGHRSMKRQDYGHRITRFLDFLQRPVFWRVERRRFGNWICFRPQVKDGRRHLMSSF
jgi:hypothetical protein